MVIVVSVVIAVSTALLAWVTIEVGTAGLQRYRESFTQRVRFQAREFFLFIDPRQLFIANLAAMALIGGAAWLVFDSVVAVLPVLAMMAVVPRLLYAWMRKRRLLKFEEQLPDALMMLAGGMRAGAGLSSALNQLVAEARAPLVQEFSLMLREQRLGVSLEQSLNNLGRRMPTQTTTLVVSAMRIAVETGGGLAETLERTSHTIRSRLQMEGKIRALTAQGKMQAWVVGLLPVFLMFILNKMEPEAMSELWHTPLGWGVLAVIAFLEVMGIYVVRKIVTIDV
ncbi:pilus assembly protein [Aquabacterium soli]|uniref:Pilus assembly protein n=1 Tax=Aquabacterium soli TaxID=2493092 RepID=A0A426VAH4_9BURK|nr:type II secretion system F family protein [Aquabacterium soli]RRS03728.1 pilus assembly protein [Aquabacterium soli]